MSSKAARPAVTFFAAALIAVGALMSLNENNNKAYKTDRRDVRLFAMDTFCDITLYGDYGDEASEQGELRSLIEELDSSLSAYSENSAIARANSGETVYPDVYAKEAIKRAVELNAEYPEADCTCGRLIDLWDIGGDDPTVPPQTEIEAALETVGSDNIIFGSDGSLSLKNGAALDLGSCAKGYSLDKIKRRLVEADLQCAIVSFGSSILLHGKKPDGESFKISVADPENPTMSVLSVTLDECFISTSGGYERFFEADGKIFSHILDLNSGYPVKTDITSVTVISKEDGMLTDHLSTCIFIGGTKRLDEYLADDKIGLIALDKDKNIYCSESIKDNIEILNNSYRFK